MQTSPKPLEIQALEEVGRYHLTRGNYREAERYLARAIELTQEIETDRRESNLRARLHKGEMFHNYGAACYYLSRPEIAVGSVLAAYMEDLISHGKVERTQDAYWVDTLPASRFLRMFLGFDFVELQKVDNEVIPRKELARSLRILNHIEVKSNPPRCELKSFPALKSLVAATSKRFRKSGLFKTPSFDIEGQQRYENGGFREAAESYAAWLTTVEDFERTQDREFDKSYVLLWLGLCSLELDLEVALSWLLRSLGESNYHDRSPERFLVWRFPTAEVLFSLGVQRQTLERLLKNKTIREELRKPWDPWEVSQVEAFLPDSVRSRYEETYRMNLRLFG